MLINRKKLDYEYAADSKVLYRWFWCSPAIMMNSFSDC